jgi:NAD(P)-dependent dehydrogenase (short-subunit alcohol dehydrogenase family)
MADIKISKLFDIQDKCVAITGGAGVLCSTMAREFAQLGAKLSIIDYDVMRANEVAKAIECEGGIALPVEANVLEKDAIEDAFKCTVDSLGQVDILINGAGGNKKEATAVLPDMSYFDLDAEAIRWVFDLNCLGTMLPCQVFGKYMADRGAGNIINVASMSGFHPLTRVVGYSAAKAAIMNFTEWLAVYMAQNHSPDIRVNAIAPGFFLTDQNRFLLTDENTGELTDRGQTIINNTPAGRFGEPGELIGTMLWLMSAASNFVTGIVVPVDGGFNAFSGV